MKSALMTPGMLADESAKTDLDAMQRRQQFGVYTIIGTLICGLFLPIIAVGGYILVSIVFFITPTVIIAREKLKKRG